LIDHFFVVTRVKAHHVLHDPVQVVAAGLAAVNGLEKADGSGCLQAIAGVVCVWLGSVFKENLARSVEAAVISTEPENI
jgi:hypothetical protein